MKHITYEVQDPVAVITLDRPEALNALTYPMMDSLREAVSEAEGDPAAVGIIITVQAGASARVSTPASSGRR